MATLKLTDELCDNICKDIKEGVPIVHASVANGISTSTFYSWYDKGKEAKSGKYKKFYDEINEARSVAVTLRAKRVYKAGETSWQADAWWLERVDPENFGRKDHHKIESENTNINFNMKSDDEVLKEHADTFERFVQRRMCKTDADTNLYCLQ